ncbi:MAG TPA: tetratricopeptide repeat protein, partial [Myxococcaceae bacterium]|nr:tetratricopeptide repeat protein [Myxococcaceae bacterium]
MSRSQPSHIPPAMSRRVARLSWWLAAVLAIAGGAMGTAAGRQLSRVTRFAPPAVAAQQVRTDEEALLASEPKDRARVRFTRYDAKKGAQGPSDREGDLPARFLRALDALRSSQFRLAAGEFAALTEEYPALANRARFFGARAHIGLDRPLSAAALLESVQKDASIYADARLLLAQLHRKGERPQEAEGILRALLGHPPLKDRPALRAQALWQLAEVQRGRGDTAAERGTMLSLWSEHPDS